MNLAIAMPEDITRKIINTNLLGTIFLNQLFSTLLIRNNNGRIINFSTVAVNLAIKGESVYTASKAGIESYSRTLAKELSRLAPGTMQIGLKAYAHQDNMSFDEALPYLQTQIAECFKSDDAKEGISAFLEKRDPKWD